MKNSHKMKITKYSKNPFIDLEVLKFDKKKVSFTRKVLSHSIIDHETGNLASIAIQGQRKAADREEYVKIYTANVGVLFDLTPPAQKVFQVVLQAVQKTAINKDRIHLSLQTARRLADKMGCILSKSAYYDGIKELIYSKIVAKSDEVNIFFINPKILFNGDRVTFINSLEAPKEIEHQKNQISYH